MQITKYYTFIDGKTPAGLVTADRLNGNLDAILNVANGNIEDDNIKAGAKILVSNRNYIEDDKITGDFEFDAFPTVPNASIPDAKLSANVPLKNATNAFSAKQTFNAGTDHNKQQAENFVFEKVSSLPGWTSADIGRTLFDTTAGKAYVGGNSAWKQIDYTGGYTGGSIRAYASLVTTDDNDSAKLFFKTEGATPTVYLQIMGLHYPRRFYTELPYHDHSFTGIAHSHGVTDAGHTHTTTMGLHGHGTTQFSLATHIHDVTGDTGNESVGHVHTIPSQGTSSDNEHYHEGVEPAVGATEVVPVHYHTFSGTTNSNSVSHYHSMSFQTSDGSTHSSVAQADLGDKVSQSKVTGLTVNNQTAGGTVGFKGVNSGLSLSTTQKKYGKSLIIKIDGTDVTSAILTATGWSVIGDGLATHAFHVSGSGELDASAYVTFSPGFHTLEIMEPESGYGCNVMVHIESL